MRNECITGVGCPSPKQPPPNSNLEPFGYPVGEMIPVDGTVRYRCRGGMRFRGNLSQSEVGATCVKGDEWVEPEEWGTCMESESVNRLREATATRNKKGHATQGH